MLKSEYLNIRKRVSWILKGQYAGYSRVIILDIQDRVSLILKSEYSNYSKFSTLDTKNLEKSDTQK